MSQVAFSLLKKLHLPEEIKTISKEVITPGINSKKLFLKNDKFNIDFDKLFILQNDQV